ncbi:hypothetical protein RCC89_02010 [Cytophagaceae bacterium ABcell3]|nr:hypothetical protein RCC89_02010 [Cytophagaceae bacterium ABcell3]
MHFRSFIKEHNVKALHLHYNGEIIENYLAFDENGFLLSKKNFNSPPSRYIYKNNKLNKIVHPVRIYGINADSIKFSYKNDKVREGSFYSGGSVFNKVNFSYYSDSTLITSPSRKIVLHYENGIIVKEDVYWFGKPEYSIIFDYTKENKLKKKEFRYYNGDFMHEYHFGDDIKLYNVVYRNSKDTSSIVVKDDIICIKNYQGEEGASVYLHMERF